MNLNFFTSLHKHGKIENWYIVIRLIWYFSNIQIRAIHIWCIIIFIIITICERNHTMFHRNFRQWFSSIALDVTQWKLIRIKRILILCNTYDLPGTQHILRSNLKSTLYHCLKYKYIEILITYMWLDKYMAHFIVAWTYVHRILWSCQSFWISLLL